MNATDQFVLHLLSTETQHSYYRGEGKDNVEQLIPGKRVMLKNNINHILRHHLII